MAFLPNLTISKHLLRIKKNRFFHIVIPLKCQLSKKLAGATP